MRHYAAVLALLRFIPGLVLPCHRVTDLFTSLPLPLTLAPRSSLQQDSLARSDFRRFLAALLLLFLDEEAAFIAFPTC